jgi:hypothetical protein
MTAGQCAGSSLSAVLISTMNVRGASACLIGGAVCSPIAVLALRALPRARVRTASALPDSSHGGGSGNALRDVLSSRSLWIPLSCLVPTAAVMLSLPGLVTILAAQMWSQTPGGYGWLRFASAGGLVLGGLIAARRKGKPMTPLFLAVAVLCMSASGLLLAVARPLLWQVAVIGALTIAWVPFRLVSRPCCRPRPRMPSVAV